MPNNLISFDIWRTLFVPNPIMSVMRAQIIAQFFGLVEYDGASFRPHISQACKDLDAQTDATGVQYGFADRTRLALERCGFRYPSDDELDEVYRQVRAYQLASIDRMPTLTESSLPNIFRQLVEDGRQLAVVSNTGMTEGAELSEMLDAHGLGKYLTYRIYSDEVGSAKPGPEIFAELTRRSGIAPHEILHVGDNVKADLKGAHGAGLGGLLYDPTYKHPYNVWRYDTHRTLLGSDVLTL